MAFYFHKDLTNGGRGHAREANQFNSQERGFIPARQRCDRDVRIQQQSSI